jgi:hypothetical protein
MSLSIDAIVAGNLREHAKRKGQLKPFTLFWLNGQREVVHGFDAANALTNAGYSSGALRALDFYKDGDSGAYVWHEETRTWIAAH